MLVFEFSNGAAAPDVADVLASLCKDAGYRVADAGSNEEIDGLLLLDDGASNAPPRRYRHEFIAAGQLAKTPSRSDVTREAPRNLFLYPTELGYATALGSRDDASAWLAGFATFTACVKTWRSLQGRTSRSPLADLHVNHVNIVTQDLANSVDFYSRVFGASYCYNLGPKKVVMELNGFDFFIEQAAEVRYPEGYHIGFRADPAGVEKIADIVSCEAGIKLVKGNGPAPGHHLGPDRVRSAIYFEDPDGLTIEVYSPEIEMLETNRHLVTHNLS